MSENGAVGYSSSLPPPWDRIFSVGTRVFVWCLFFGILFILRSFFLLILLTFVFAYIQEHGVEILGPYIGNRHLRVVFMGVTLLGILVAIGTFLVPRVRQQAELFAEKYPLYFQNIDEEILMLSEEHPLLRNLIMEAEEQQIVGSESSEPITASGRKSPTAEILNRLFGFDSSQEENVKHVLDILRKTGHAFLSIASAFLLSLLFSFLIVLDLPQLTSGVQSLADTKLRFVYEEVAYSIRDFGKVLGRALEAQVVIGLLNTLLTAAAIYILGLGKSLAFLSVIVFLCSLIPIAGVFISSVPICLLALQESGLSGVLLAIGLVWIIHMIEAYVLNPKIFGHRLRLNPVLVLIVLTICGKLFHIWGLVLGLPVCKYFFGHAIRRRSTD